MFGFRAPRYCQLTSYVRFSGSYTREKPNETPTPVDGPEITEASFKQDCNKDEMPAKKCNTKHYKDAFAHMDLVSRRTSPLSETERVCLTPP